MTTVALVLFDLNSDHSTLRSFISPQTAGEIVSSQVESSQVFGGKPTNPLVAPGRPAHTYFGTSGKTKTREVEKVERVDLVGQWAGAVDAASVHTTWQAGSCLYEIRTLDFQLRSSGKDVFGYGTYTLFSDGCPQKELITRYASATGKITTPYLKLNIKNTGSGQTDLVYYGTIEHDGIFGQVRSGYGELLAEHLRLVRR